MRAKPILLLLLVSPAVASDNYFMLSKGKATIRLEDKAQKLFGSSLKTTDINMDSYRIGFGHYVRPWLAVEGSADYFRGLSATGAEDHKRCISLRASHDGEAFESPEYCYTYGYSAQVEGDIMGVSFRLVPRYAFALFGVPLDVHGAAGIMYARATLLANAEAHTSFTDSVEIPQLGKTYSGPLPVYGFGFSAGPFAVDFTQYSSYLRDVSVSWKYIF